MRDVNDPRRRGRLGLYVGTRMSPPVDTVRPTANGPPVGETARYASITLASMTTEDVRELAT
jgi:hypothetical protein